MTAIDRGRNRASSRWPRPGIEIRMCGSCTSSAMRWSVRWSRRLQVMPGESSALGAERSAIDIVNMIGGLDRPTKGTINSQAGHVTAHRESVRRAAPRHHRFIFQSYN